MSLIHVATEPHIVHVSTLMVLFGVLSYLGLQVMPAAIPNHHPPLSPLRVFGRTLNFRNAETGSPLSWENRKVFNVRAGNGSRPQGII